MQTSFFIKEHCKLKVKWSQTKLEDFNEAWKSVVFTDEKKLNI